MQTKTNAIGAHLARWWWFWLVLGLVVIVEIGAAVGAIPSGVRLCPVGFDCG
jgi:uncharacterized protein involved in exopolysaccharide biosynthesis